MDFSSHSDSPPDARFARVWTRTEAVRAQNAREQWTERSSVIIALGEGGHVGFGEAAPLPGWSAESSEEAQVELETHARTFELSGLGTRPPRATLKSVQFALESAWLDLAGKLAGRPAWSILCADAAPTKLACSALLSERPEAWIEAALRVVSQGAACLKLKIGWSDMTIESQIEHLLKLAAVAQVPLRLDANAALTVEQAHTLREALRDDPRFEYVEDPVEAAHLRALSSSGLAFAADELFLRAPDAVRALQPADGLVALVVKPTLYGSLSELVSEAKAARARGVRTVLSHSFEGGIAHAALRHLAFALNDASTVVGLAPHPGLVDCPVHHQEHPFVLARSEQPGLGFDEARVLEWLDDAGA